MTVGWGTLPCHAGLSEGDDWLRRPWAGCGPGGGHRRGAPCPVGGSSSSAMAKSLCQLTHQRNILLPNLWRQPGLALQRAALMALLPVLGVVSEERLVAVDPGERIE